jgi:hypothetical protein
METLTMDVKRIKAEEVLLAYPEHKNGKLVLPTGVITHWKNKKLHNEDGPAVIYPDGYGFEYYRKGLLHRDDNLPAAKLDSRQEWLWWGVLHRIDGPAIHDEDRNIQVWAQHGKKHRYKAPAVIHEPEGYIGYWEMGLRHRIDGPARIFTLDNRGEWWLKGSLLSEEELERAKECFADYTRMPLLLGHKVLRPIAEFVKSGGTISNEPVMFK